MVERKIKEKTFRRYTDRVRNMQSSFERAYINRQQSEKKKKRRNTLIGRTAERNRTTKRSFVEKPIESMKTKNS